MALGFVAGPVGFVNLTNYVMGLFVSLVSYSMFVLAEHALVCILSLSPIFTLQKPVYYQANYLTMAIVLSSFAKFTVLLMIIWDYNVYFGLALDLFVCLSNIVSIKTYLRCSVAQASLIVLVGLIARLLVLYYASLA